MITNLATVTNEDGSITSGWGIALGVTLIVLGLALLVFILSALVSIAGSHNFTLGGKAIWIVVVLVFPFLGSVVWFLWGRSAQLNSRKTSTLRSASV